MSATPSPTPQDDFNDDASVTSSLYARNNTTASRLVNARRLRVAAENDVTFLQNRLAKLKAEENKAKNEVQKLKAKVVDVSHARERNEQTGTQRRELQDQVDYGKRKEAALIALNKEKQSEAIWTSKQKTMQARREAVVQMRNQKEINACRTQILKEEQRELNTQRRETIRQLHEQAKLRREKAAEEKKNATREFYEMRLEKENEDREQKEKLAAQLVSQEAQMIYRLKRLHTEKQKALQEMANAIDGSLSISRGGSRSSSPTAAHYNNTSLPPI